MDKNTLKKFAIESRQDLMSKMENKIKMFYIDETFSKQQNGDIYILSNENHILKLSKEEYDKRELLIKRINELGIEQVIEESAYTWFNRIVAIRYMEIHDYLPLTKDNQSLGIRLLSSKDNNPDPEIMKFMNLINPELDINFKKEKYADLKDDNEKYKYILLLICKKLGKVIPQVFDGVTDYIDILIPDNLLNESGFINKIVTEVPEDNYSEVEIIGWLYQFYNQIEKDKAMSKKKAYNKNEIAYVTQLFTPDWIVKYMVENSLGRYYIENKVNDNLSIINKWKYFIKDNIKVHNKSFDIKNVKFIDPCCGSGHILVYAFEILYQIYLDCGYNKNNISELILKNNLYGLDIDNRAGQLSILSVILKAREYDKNIFNKNIITELNILSINESNNINRLMLDFISDEEIKTKVNNLLDSFNNAKEIGSLLILKNEDYEDVIKYLSSDETIFSLELKENITPLIKIAKILQQKYDIVVTNPPYMNISVMPINLKEYLQKYFSDSKTDLCTAFMEIGLVKTDGYISMINQNSWMFLSSFEKLRKKLINLIHINTLIHLGTKAFEEIGGEIVQTSAFVLENKNKNEKSYFYKLNELNSSNIKEIEFINNKKKYEYRIDQKDFLKIPGYPIIYWISNKMIDNIEKGISIDKISDFTGSQHKTANNDKYLKFIWEVEKNKIGKNKKWIFYSKGGEYRKYYGNIEYVVDWSDRALDFYKNNPTSNCIDKKYWYKEGITFTKITSKGANFRYMENNGVFDMGGPAIVDVQKLYYCLGLLNSKIANDFFKMINPTINLQVKDVKSFPIILDDSQGIESKVNELVKENINISKDDWDLFETSWDFIKHPLIKEKESFHYGTIGDNNYKISDCYNHLKDSLEMKFNKLKENEEELNRIFIDIYGLQDELNPDVEDKDITIRKGNKERDIKSLISYAVGCMFGRYSLDKEGLIYAGGEFDETKYKTFNADKDNIIPITDDSYFADDIVSRFRNFIEVVYGKETLNENLDFIAETLGKKGTETSEDTIRRYFLNDFYKDHVKTYKKKPIYWLFDSGKKNGFKALIYMHRYNENTVPKVRLDYLHRIQNTYDKLLADVNYKLTTELSVSDKKIAQNRQADLNAKLQEIKEYDEKIAHIANQRISIDLDDGVTVNYAKFEDILAKIK